VISRSERHFLFKIGVAEGTDETVSFGIPDADQSGWNRRATLRFADLTTLLRRSHPRRSLLMVALAFGAHFCSFTYIAPFLLRDAGLSMGDIIQACRNAWTACGLQPLLGERVGLTSSILGYSLLYPYSDNYLDRAEISAETKLRFSKRFRDRLRGESLVAGDDREAAIWILVSLIEEQYPRALYPHVFHCLLAIHRAQEESIAQISGSDPCDGDTVLRMSCAKGGSSVLADACLARGWLNEEESRFSFEWGTLLQLGAVRVEKNGQTWHLFSFGSKRAI